jgi:hypothetical protein
VSGGLFLYSAAALGCLVGAVFFVNLVLAPARLYRTQGTALRDERKRALSETQSAGDDRPLSVRIDREPIWHNIAYRAYIVEVHVVMTNQTDAPMEIAAIQWQYKTGAYFHIHDPEVTEAIGRYQSSRPSLSRHSIIEPRSTESGWHLAVLVHSGQEHELPTLTVKVSGHRQLYEAFR